MIHLNWQIVGCSPSSAIEVQSDVPSIEPLLASIAKSYDTLATHQQADTITKLYNISTQSLNIPSNFQTTVT
jgi:hypothetical protein